MPSFPAKSWKQCQALYAARPDRWEVLDHRGINLIVAERDRAGKLAEALKEDAAWEILPDAADGKSQGPLL